MQVFDRIRMALLNPSETGQADRAEILRGATLAKAISGVAIYACGALAITTLIAFRTFPIIGTFFALLWAAAALFSYEANAIATNTEALMSSVFNRAAASWSTRQFVNSVTKNTLVIGPFFGDVIARELKDAQVS